MEATNKDTQAALDLIQGKLGMSLNDMAEIVKRTGLVKRSDIRWMLQREYGINHEDANLLTSALSPGQSTSSDDAALLKKV